MLWHLITGEYPPRPGGVADYTRLVARGLVAAGDVVHVWAPRGDASLAPNDSGISVHRLCDHFGRRGLRELSRGLRDVGPGQILVQYVPHMYGYRAMNLGFAAWLRWRAPAYSIMFHEVTFPMAWGQKLRHNVLGAVNRLMANLAAARAERIYVSVPVWREWLRKCGVRKPSEWLPVPSNVPTEAVADSVLRLRQELAPRGLLIGHFGTYHDRDRGHLREVFAAILRGHGDRRALMIGRGAEAFAAEWQSAEPELVGRIMARSDLPGDEVAEHLSACDLLVQPYFDGVSARRGSMMAGLGLGRPIVTNVGWATEPLWRDEGLVEPIAAGDAAGLVRRIEFLLASSEERERLAASGRRLYETTFSCRQTIERLRADALAAK